MSFKEAVFTCFFKKGTTFRGRASRSEFWWVYLFCIIIFFPALVLDFLFFGGPAACTLILLLITIIPWVALCTRRLHDVGFCGWWQLLQFTGIGALFLVILYILPSRSAGDKYNTN